MTSISRFRSSSPTTGEGARRACASLACGVAASALSESPTAPSGADGDLPRLVKTFPEAGELGLALVASGLTVAVAESCTGGLLGAALTAFAGSSAYVRGGVIAYADDVKAEQLGVGRHLLATHGAVSPEVAAAMASGVRSRFEASLGVGITGVAGPEASERKPPGLVFVAVADAASVRVIRLDDDHGREVNRVLAVRAAIQLCAEIVQGLPERASGTPERR